MLGDTLADPAWQAWIDREVVLGVRPEHLQPRDAGEAALHARLEVLEPVGNETFLNLRCGELVLAKLLRERLLGDQGFLEGAGDTLVRQRREPDRNRRFLDRLADRGNRAGIDRERRGEVAVGGVDPPSGKDQGTGRERHAAGAFDHQQLGRSARALADQDQRCCGDRLVAHPQRRLHATDVLLVGFLRIDGIVDRRILFLLRILDVRLGRGLRVGGVHRRLVGDLVQIGFGLVELRVLDRILVAVVARAKRQNGTTDDCKSQSFHCLVFPVNHDESLAITALILSFTRKIPI